MAMVADAPACLARGWSAPMVRGGDVGYCGGGRSWFVSGVVVRCLPRLVIMEGPPVSCERAASGAMRSAGGRG